MKVPLCCEELDMGGSYCQWPTQWVTFCWSVILQRGPRMTVVHGAGLLVRHEGVAVPVRLPTQAGCVPVLAKTRGP